jgi:hypothetical protein
MALIDSHRTSASTSNPTLVDDGTPAGHPTPAGEPPSAEATSPEPTAAATTAEAVGDEAASQEQPDLFPRAQRVEKAAPANNCATLEAIGRLVVAWGHLEHTTAEKLAGMRQSFGDVRAVGGRSRPTMRKLLAELRALVAMRDRHDKQVLSAIAEIDGTLQRIAQFRQLVIDGAQLFRGQAVICHDLKNMIHDIGPDDLAREAAQLERIRCQIAAL